MKLLIYYDEATDRIEVEEYSSISDKSGERINWLRDQGAPVKLIEVNAITTPIKELIRR